MSKISYKAQVGCQKLENFFGSKKIEEIEEQ
jgi:hypothetical protein